MVSNPLIRPAVSLGQPLDSQHFGELFVGSENPRKNGAKNRCQLVVPKAEVLGTSGFLVGTDAKRTANGAPGMPLVGVFVVFGAETTRNRT